MNLAELNKVARAMVAPGKGILAADESSGTIKKRFDAIGVENTEANRRDYRELMFSTGEAMSKYVSGVILVEDAHPGQFRARILDKTVIVVDLAFGKFIRGERDMEVVVEVASER